MASNLVLSATSSETLVRYIAVSNRTTPRPLSGLHTIISLLAANNFSDFMPLWLVEKFMDIKIIKLFKREWMDLIQKFSEIVAKTL